MANTTSGTYDFEKNFSIDEIIEESFQRMGIQNVTGYELKTSRRTLDIMIPGSGIRFKTGVYLDLTTTDSVTIGYTG